MQHDAGLQQMAQHLSDAYSKYTHLFGEPLHGTPKQFAALLELCPQAKAATALWDAKRIEMETV